jgi:hypothetical protein
MMLRGWEGRKCFRRKEAKRGARKERWGELKGWADIKFHLASHGDSVLSFR